MGVLKVGALLIEVYIRAPDFWKLPVNVLGIVLSCLGRACTTLAGGFKGPNRC